MKPYMLIEGSNQTIDAFEQKVAAALEMGYSLAGDLLSHTTSSTEIKFFQPVILAEEEEDEEEYDEEYEDEDAI
jgi:hypothetical protein